ncbi:MAG: hypothetical protein HW414_1682 [Dehalococcoidia bacterium]|nr:hypothetical protein [Dehalococcoidia bacterium]
MPGSDFWWLLPEEARRFRYVELFHQQPYSDEPHTDKDPYSCPMEPSDKRSPLTSVTQWKAEFKNINVFRSFALHTTRVGGDELIGPFLLDVDRTTEQDGGYLPDFDRALRDTRSLVTEYCSSLRGDSYRIFFSGHKGFHVEIHPRAINTPHNTGRLPYFESKRKEVNEKFGANFVDRFHEHLRLHHSANCWIDYGGHTACLMNYEVSVNELFRLSADEMLSRAKNLAWRCNPRV